MMEEEAMNGLVEFPQNRTLYVDQFTDDAPYSQEERMGVQANCLEDAFGHYRPKKADVAMESLDGSIRLETFHFHDMEDFEDDRLIEQSESLLMEKETIDTLRAIIFQLGKNKALRNALNDKESRDGLREMIVAIAGMLGASRDVDIQKTAAIQHENLSVLRNVISNIENLDPSHPARSAVFLSDSMYYETRLKLKSELELWVSLLKTDDADPEKIINECNNRYTEAEQHLQKMLLHVREEISRLEITYRSLEAFFANAGQGCAGQITLMNTKKKDLALRDSEDLIAVRTELKNNYDTLDLKKSYSLLVIPGYPGDADTLRRWASIAHSNKVILATDFKDCHDFNELKEELQRAHLNGSDVELANVVMSCNYLLGRKKSELAGEEDDLYIPGSGALAGRMANTDEISIIQGVVGREYGVLNHVKGVRIDLLKSETATLINQGVIPMVSEGGRVIAFSNRTLYNGTSINLQEYPVVRMFEWVKKVLMNYTHEIALENWNPYKSPRELKEKIQQFLNHYQIYHNYFSSYKVGEPFQNPNTKNVTVELSITPFYTNKNYLVKLQADNKNHKVSDIKIEQQ